MPSILYRITSPRFVAGIIIEDGRVTETAPIIYWLRGKPVEDLKTILVKYGWKIERVS